MKISAVILGILTALTSLFAFAGGGNVGSDKAIPAFWCMVPESHSSRLPGGNVYIQADGTADVWVQNFVGGLKEVKISFTNVQSVGDTYTSSNQDSTFVLKLVRKTKFESYEAVVTVFSPRVADIGYSANRSISFPLICGYKE